MKPMVFWGASGQSKVLRECMRNAGYRLVALFDNDEGAVSPFPDVPVYHGVKGFEDWVERKPTNRNSAFLVAIGGDKGKDRRKLQGYLESKGLKPLTARHRTAFVAEDAVIGVG